jgi:AcrR family transcriptional regulator
MEEPMAVTKLRTVKSANHPVVLSSPKNGDAGPTGARRDLLAAEVLDKAASLFALRGFAATSLKDVADAVGLQRSSIYYYYPNKDALLKELIQGVTLPVARIFRDVEAESLSPLAKVREVVRRLVLWVADPRTHFRLMDRSEAELPQAIAKVHREAKRHVLRKMIELIEAAVLAGEARATDPRVSALSIIGMAMWTAWWFRPNQDRSLADVADEIANSAAAVVQRAAPAKQIATVGELTSEIRKNLALIDRLAERTNR